MLNLDVYVDALEDAVAAKGVLNVDLKQMAPEQNGAGTRERAGILIEMLRVWMEHRWRAGHPVSVLDCLAEFPEESFSDDELESLRFEEQRLRTTGVKTAGPDLKGWAIESLPNTGEMWGEFELLGVLGTGAFAKVYLAKQHGLAGRLVALKLTFRKTHESHWLATLQHSAIVPIYSTHCADRVYGICMPFLGNTTLADLLHETPRSVTVHKSNWWSKSKRNSFGGGGALLTTIQQRQGQIDTIVNTVGSAEESNAGQSVSTSSTTNRIANSPASQNLSRCDYVDSICWIGAQLADALSYAHRSGVVHSDIKPANILVAFDGQPRLLDFNVSYKGTSDGVVSTDLPLGGTIPYMSPEHRQALNNSAVVDARSDLFSLGVVLYEMLTGHLPKQSKSETADPRKWNPSVSPAMSAIIRKCLEHDVGARYQSADELRDDLTAQFHREPLVHQPEPSHTERLIKWCYRHPRVSSSLSIASLATLLIGFLLSGLVVRQFALNRANWVHRVDQLKERIPNSMAMLTSLEAFPELEPDVAADLEKTFALVASSSNPKQIDQRWNTHAEVSAEARSELNMLAWLAKIRTWKKSLDIPDGLMDDMSSSDPLQRNQLMDQPLKLIQAREYGAAISFLKKSIEENPRGYVGWWLLGDSYKFNADALNSQQAFTVCIALQPKSPIAYLNRAEARFSASMFSLAAEDFGKALTLAPSWHWSRLTRALALQKQGLLREAIAELDKAIDAGYSTVSILRLRGELLTQTGDLESAKMDFAKALECEPQTDRQWVDRGLIRLASNPAEAAKDFEQALAINPNHVDAHQKLAYVYNELLNNPEKSLEHSDRLVKLAPSQPTHLAGRAVLHARAGRLQPAIDDLKSLEKMHIQDPIEIYQVACGYSLLAGIPAKLVTENTDFSKAAFRWFTKAVGEDPAILAIAMTDPDVQWMRQQSQFQEIARAVTTLKLNLP